VNAVGQHDPWWLWLAVLGGLALLTILATWLNAREKQGGKRRSHAVRSRAGVAALELQALFMKAPRNVLEAKQKQRKCDAGQGGLPPPPSG
jgi:hypothetical protein